MTALSQYQRLECPGVWTPEPGARRINVIVSFGNSSLVISDGNNRALSHWSLAATERVNPDESPAFYSPTAEASELLEIDDDTMIEAIETVRRAVNRTRPVRGRLRVLGLVGSAAAGLALGVFWLPATRSMWCRIRPARKSARNCFRPSTACPASHAARRGVSALWPRCTPGWCRPVQGAG